MLRSIRRSDTLNALLGGRVAIWWPWALLQMVLFGLPVLGYVAFFPNELVVKIRMILSLKHLHIHTKCVP